MGRCGRVGEVSSTSGDVFIRGSVSGPSQIFFKMRTLAPFKWKLYYTIYTVSQKGDTVVHIYAVRQILTYFKNSFTDASYCKNLPHTLSVSLYLVFKVRNYNK